MEALAAGAVGSTHPTVLPGQRKGNTEINVQHYHWAEIWLGFLARGTAFPSSPLWERCQDGRAGGECQRGHFCESPWVLLALCCTPGLGTFPSTPCSARDAPCTEFTHVLSATGIGAVCETPISAMTTAFTPKGPKMSILKDSKSSRKILPHGSDSPLQVGSCASVSPLGTQRDEELLLQLLGNGTAGRDLPWAPRGSLGCRAQIPIFTPKQMKGWAEPQGSVWVQQLGGFSPNPRGEGTAPTLAASRGCLLPLSRASTTYLDTGASQPR